MSETGKHSWVESANEPGSDFPLRNLPFGVFSAGSGSPRIGVAIGDEVLDVSGCIDAGLIADLDARAAIACKRSTLNPLMALPRNVVSELRRSIGALLTAGASSARKAQDLLLEAADVEMHLPAEIGDYTDFYASIDHARNVGSMFRPDNPLLPNYRHLPIGYHGRASSIVASGSSVRRPSGQIKPPDSDNPTFGPSRSLDFESEVGFFVAQGNTLGETIPLARAWDHIFGFCLVNDWSARDIQAWEYQPLGPFLAKNFATTVSPWVVTADALEPFRVRARARSQDDPPVLSYLASAEDAARGAIALTTEVFLRTRAMRDRGLPEHRLSRASFAGMFWTPAQMLAHHASGGCNMRPGDLLASGTVSGPDRDSRGCMLELTWRGSEPVTLPSGEERRFLEDGDEVTIKGFCEGEDGSRIGFGTAMGTITPALKGDASA